MSKLAFERDKIFRLTKPYITFLKVCIPGYYWSCLLERKRNMMHILWRCGLNCGPYRVKQVKKHD